MESDVYLATGGSQWEKALWKPEYVRDNTPLTTDHILLPLITIAISLLLAVVTFFLELIHFRYSKKDAGSTVRKITVKAADSNSGGIHQTEDGTQVKLGVNNKNNLSEIKVDSDEILVGVAIGEGDDDT